jgi:hypothetical protein
MPSRRQKTPRYYYNSHKQTAKQRCIPWEFTFETWWKVWEESGKWEGRGCKKGEYGMNRHNDVGPYSPTNVSIGEAGQNARVALKDWGKKKRAREAKENGESGLQPERLSTQTEKMLGADDLSSAARTFTENGKQFYQSTQQSTQNKKKKRLTFFQKLFFPFINWFKQQRV